MQSRVYKNNKIYIYFTIYLVNSKKSSTFAPCFEKHCKNSINVLNIKIFMKKKFLIVKNGKVMFTCTHYNVAIALFKSVCNKSDISKDLIYLYKHSYGIIKEF